MDSRHRNEARDWAESLRNLSIAPNPEDFGYVLSWMFDESRKVTRTATVPADPVVGLDEQFHGRALAIEVATRMRMLRPDVFTTLIQAEPKMVTLDVSKLDLDALDLRVGKIEVHRQHDAGMVLTPMQRYAELTNADAPDMLGVVAQRMREGVKDELQYAQRECEIDDGKKVEPDGVRPEYKVDTDKLLSRNLRGVIGPALSDQFPEKDFPNIEITYDYLRTHYDVAATAKTIESAVACMKPNDPLVGW